MCRCHSPFVDTVFRAVSQSVGSQRCSPSVSFFSNEAAKGLVGNTQISFVEYVAHPADFVFKLPEKTGYEEATLFEPLAVGLHSVVRAKVSFGGEILILGAGSIGLATLQVVVNIGGGRVTVADIYDFRLKKTRELGADKVINPQQSDALDKLRSRRGRKVILVGLPPQEAIEFNTNQIITKELDVLGIFRYANMYPKAVRLAEKGQVDLKTLISKKFPFPQTEEALKYARDNKESSIKTLVIFD